MKKTVAFDFDGVIHSYESGWQGAAVVPDPPVPGIKESIEALRAAGYEVVIVSSRANTEEGFHAIHNFLQKNEIEVDMVTNNKPAAVCIVDDRAIYFDGNAKSLVEKIVNFRPWNAKEAKV